MERVSEASSASFRGKKWRWSPAVRKFQVRCSEKSFHEHFIPLEFLHHSTLKTKPASTPDIEVQTNPKQFFSLNIFSGNFRFRRWRYPSPQTIRLFSDISNLVLVSDPVGLPIGLLFGLHMGRPLRESWKAVGHGCAMHRRTHSTTYWKENTFLLKIKGN